MAELLCSSYTGVSTVRYPLNHTHLDAIVTVCDSKFCGSACSTGRGCDRNFHLSFALLNLNLSRLKYEFIGIPLYVLQIIKMLLYLSLRRERLMQSWQKDQSSPR